MKQMMRMKRKAKNDLRDTGDRVLSSCISGTYQLMDLELGRVQDVSIYSEDKR